MNRSRTEVLSIRLTKDEYDALSRKAARADMSLSDYVRRTLTDDNPMVARAIEIHVDRTTAPPVNIIWTQHPGLMR